MIGEIQANKVVLGGDARNRFYDSSGYGRPDNSKLSLSLVEAAHLLYRDKIEVEHGSETFDFDDFLEFASEMNELFLPLYSVYSDLRERGYYVQHRPSDDAIDVYPRGEKPSTSSPAETVRVVTERDFLSAANLVKEEIIGIVDDENDVTYFEVEEWDERGGTPGVESSNIEGELLGKNVVIDSSEVEGLYSRSFYGSLEKDEDKLERVRLSLLEAVYLSDIGVLDSPSKDEILDKVDDRFELKSRVYADLRQRSLCPKTGFKFGTHFRAYNTVQNVDDLPHSEYLVHAVPNDYVFGIPEVSRAVRLAHGVRKEMVFAVVEESTEEVEIQYFSVGRYRP